MEMDKRRSGLTWLDGVLVKQMAHELERRGANCGDAESVKSALADANFGDRAVNRLADQAALLASQK